ncbi:hypothetical protein KKA14_16755, partial [bacterium]|nr:hypothetical protein [bacterium]
IRRRLKVRTDPEGKIRIITLGNKEQSCLFHLRSQVGEIIYCVRQIALLVLEINLQNRVEKRIDLVVNSTVFLF